MLDPVCTAPASGSGAEEAEAGCAEAEIEVDVDEVAELCVKREPPIREEIWSSAALQLWQSLISV